MSDGTMLILPVPANDHVCRPPGTPSCIAAPDYPQFRHRTEIVTGGLWICGCGQYWEGVDHHWEPIGRRRARRLMKRARR